MITIALHIAMCLLLQDHMHIVRTKPLLSGGAQAHPTAMPPLTVMETIEKIEDELASIHAM